MFTTLALSAALFAGSAPLPKQTAMSGPAPRVMDVQPNADGKIVFNVIREEKRKIGVAAGNAINPNGGAAPAVLEREVTVQVNALIPLVDLKDLSITTAGGKTLDAKEALSRLEKGGVVVISSDGKPVDSNFLKVFKEETMVLASPDLVNIAGRLVPRPGVVGGGVVRPLPAPLPAPLPPAAGAAGGIQIQIAPAIGARGPIAVPGPKPEDR